MFSVKFSTIIFKNNDNNKNLHFSNEFSKVCGHKPNNYCSKWKFTAINGMSLFEWPWPKTQNIQAVSFQLILFKILCKSRDKSTHFQVTPTIYNLDVKLFIFANMLHFDSLSTLPFLLMSSSTKFMKFPISGGRRSNSLSLSPNFRRFDRRKKCWKKKTSRKYVNTTHNSFQFLRLPCSMLYVKYLINTIHH